MVGFAIAQPFLVRAALGYVRNHRVLPNEFGYGLIGAFGLVYVGVVAAVHGVGVARGGCLVDAPA